MTAFPALYPVFVRRVAACAVLGAPLLAAGLASPAQAAVEQVSFAEASPGTIVIKTRERKLYLALGNGTALRYPVAVGKAGKQWRGEARIDGKYVEPAWSPPDDVKRDKPWMPAVIPPGPNNPMGARALTLDRGEYAIHGTTRAMRASIGTYASYGCIRMFNEDVIDLYERVPVGTRVVVVP
jgi:lipoprotein-anchoring transpeptidase ErfK/SrfK